MTTNKQLRELAEKAKSGSWFEPGDLHYEDARSGYMHGLHHDEDGFIAAASPDRVLELLDENEALQAEYEQLRKDAAAALSGLPDSLPMEPYQAVDRGSPHYKAGWNACRRAMLDALEKLMEDPNHDQ